MDSTSQIIALGVILCLFEIVFGAPTGLDILAVGLSLLTSVFILFSIKIPMIFTIAILLVVYFIAIRPTFRKKFLLAMQQIGIDVIVGKVGTVITAISSKEKGLVMIDGELWNAQSKKTISKGEKIEVMQLTAELLEVDL